MRLASLFDGSGGFPLAARMCGIVPIWAAEVDPFAIAVTRKNFPTMQHFGDVRGIDGANVPPVDVITFGSPCQDMSIAGARAGIDGVRSGLFFEATRIFKEMRVATDGRSPRFIVWENVFGALSSNDGEDFRRVLEELLHIAGCTEFSVPRPPKKWSKSGAIVGNAFSLAWRVLDARFWGVPQRRRRIFVVVDCGGQRASEILFKRASVRGDHKENTSEGEATPAASSVSVRTTDREDKAFTLRIRGGKPGGGEGALVQNNLSGTLSTHNDQTLFCFFTRHTQANGKPGTTGSSFTLSSSERHGLFYRMFVCDNHGADCRYKIVDSVGSLTCRLGSGGCNAPIVTTSHTAFDSEINNNTAFCLAASYYKTPPRIFDNRKEEVVVRSMTPTECARLQGFPDDWAKVGPIDDGDLVFWRGIFNKWSEITGSKKKTDKQIAKWLSSPYRDASEYKLWGNGVALPCVFYILDNIAKLNKEV